MLFPLILASMVWFASGCDLIGGISAPEQGAPDQSTDPTQGDMSASVRDMQGETRLEFEPNDTLEFRAVARGETASVIVSLINRSQGPVTIAELTVQEEGLGDTAEVALALPWALRTLEPGERVLVNVVWRPTDDEIDYGTLRATTTAPLMGLVTLGFTTPRPLTIDPAVRLESDQASIELSATPHLEAATMPLVVRVAEDSAPFVFSGAYILYDEPFSQEVQEDVKLFGLPGAGLRFEAGETFSFSLEFGPKDYIAKRGTVVIQGESSTLRVPFALMPTRPPLHQSFEHGLRFACALGESGQVMCWGSDYLGPNDDPSLFEKPVANAPTQGAYVSIATGVHHACTLDAQGSPACWGRNRWGETVVPQGAVLKQIVAGYAHTCGLREDDTAVCWGTEQDGRSTPPVGTFIKLFADFEDTCGLRDDSSLECWGSNSKGNDMPPALRWLGMGVGLKALCGIDSQLGLHCWGPRVLKEDPPREGQFLEVAVSEVFACALAKGGEIRCWGAVPEKIRAGIPTGLNPTRLSVGFKTACVVFQERLVCWGDDTEGLLLPPSTPLLRP